MKKKIINYLVVGMLLTTICFTVQIENVKGASEVPVDTSFIEEILDQLTDYASDIYWNGREYNSLGERTAATYLMNKWDSEIADVSIPISEDEHIESTLDEEYMITDINNYYLKIDGVEIDEQSCFPFWLHKKAFSETYEVVLIPEEWYDEFHDIPESDEFFDENLISKYSYHVEYFLLNDFEKFSGNIVYIDDYETARLNDTEGKVHLIEFPPSFSDELFNTTVNKVVNSNGSGFIAIVTNPLFIKKVEVDIPGVAISRFDGDKIKKSIEENEFLYMDIKSDEWLDMGISDIIYIKKYTINIRDKKNIETNYYMVDFKNIFKINCKKILSSVNSPLNIKKLQLSIQVRGELRDKLSYYYGRIPKEDKIKED